MPTERSMINLQPSPRLLWSPPPHRTRRASSLLLLSAPSPSVSPVILLSLPLNVWCNPLPTRSASFLPFRHKGSVSAVAEKGGGRCWRKIWERGGGGGCASWMCQSSHGPPWGYTHDKHQISLTKTAVPQRWSWHGWGGISALQRPPMGISREGGSEEETKEPSTAEVAVT